MRERTALVTGGSTGIGESICKHFLNAGYTVLNLARRSAVIECTILRWTWRTAKPRAQLQQR